MARLDREHAAERGGPDDRSVGLRAERERHHAGGHRRRRSRRGAAGRVRVVVRVARRTGMIIGELGRHRLADDDGAGGAQLGDYSGVVARPTAAADGGAELGRIIRGVDDVLDRDWNAVQRADRVSLRAALVERARLRERVLAVEMGECLDLAVEGFDAVEAGAGIFLGRNGAAGDFRCGLACSQYDELVGHSGVASAAVEIVRQPERHPRPQIHDHHANDDDDHVRHHASENLIERDVPRRDAHEVERRHRNRRRQERGL